MITVPIRGTTAHLEDLLAPIKEKVRWKTAQRQYPPDVGTWLFAAFVLVAILGVLRAERSSSAGLVEHGDTAGQVWPAFAGYAALLLVTGGPIVAARFWYGEDLKRVETVFSWSLPFVLLVIPVFATRRLALRRVGLTRGRPLTWGVAVAVVGVVALNGVLNAFESLSWGGWEDDSTSWVAQTDFNWVVVVQVVLSGAAQEIFFRGFMQTTLRTRWRSSLAIIVTSACYALFYPGWPGAPRALLNGLYLGFLRERAGSVWPAVACHVVGLLAWRLYRRSLVQGLIESVASTWGGLAWLGVLAVFVTLAVMWLHRNLLPRDARAI